jgi:hypothetical protein
MSTFYPTTQKRKRKISTRVLWASIHGICLLKETGKLSLIDEEENTEDLSCFLIERFTRRIKSQQYL